LNPCPPDQTTGSTDSGRCCDDGFCSCGGECCGGPDCWIVTTELTPPGAEPRRFAVEEHCTPPQGCIPCPNSGETCCSACINDECASSGPIRGGSIRRR
jgi:hypothetical protein